MQRKPVSAAIFSGRGENQIRLNKCIFQTVFWDFYLGE
jgi:hypothetical protein